MGRKRKRGEEEACNRKINEDVRGIIKKNLSISFLTLKLTIESCLKRGMKLHAGKDYSPLFRIVHVHELKFYKIFYSYVTTIDRTFRKKRKKKNLLRYFVLLEKGRVIK